MAKVYSHQYFPVYCIDNEDYSAESATDCFQDSYTITRKQIVRFQKRMHLEKFQINKIQNGRLSASIHLDRPDIAEYHENRSR